MSVPPGSNGLIFFAAWIALEKMCWNLYDVDILERLCALVIVGHKHTQTHLYVTIFLACPFVMRLFWAECSTERVAGLKVVFTH